MIRRTFLALMASFPLGMRLRRSQDSPDDETWKHEVFSALHKALPLEYEVHATFFERVIDGDQEKTGAWITVITSAIPRIQAGQYEIITGKKANPGRS